MANAPATRGTVRCAIYARKSTDDRFQRDFNSIETQREVCSAYVSSQRHKGWIELGTAYDDLGQSGGTLERPALQRLLGDIESGIVDVVVIYKIDRLTRSLADFVRLVDHLDRFGVAFVSITQSFDTSDSMGRLVLNVLLTFAQFEREMIADRIRDKVAAMKRRGKWTGGPPPFGYDVVEGRLIVNAAEAETVRRVYRRFLELGSYVALREELRAEGLRTKIWTNRKGVVTGGGVVSSGMVYNMLASRFYVGEVPHHDQSFPGEHEAIVDRDLWDRAQAQRARRSMYKLNLGPSPNILLGFLIDGFGRPMTIVDDSTKGTRYRYYISNQARWASRKHLKRVRVEANGLEQIVVSAIQTFLCNREACRGALARLGRTSAVLERLGAKGASAAKRLGTLDVERLRLVSIALLARVEVASDHVDVQLRVAEVERFLDWDGRGVFRAGERSASDERANHLLRVPATVTRQQRALVMPVEPAAASARTHKVPQLVALVREARRAQAAIDADRVSTLSEICVRFNRTPGFFARLLRLNYLAPDIITALLDGRQPHGLTRKKLIDANIPMDWAMQRKMLGFEERADIQDVTGNSKKTLSYTGTDMEHATRGESLCPH